MSELDNPHFTLINQKSVISSKPIHPFTIADSPWLQVCGTKPGEEMAQGALFSRTSPVSLNKEKSLTSVPSTLNSYKGLPEATTLQNKWRFTLQHHDQMSRLENASPEFTLEPDDDDFSSPARRSLIGLAQTFLQKLTHSTDRAEETVDLEAQNTGHAHVQVNADGEWDIEAQPEGCDKLGSFRKVLMRFYLANQRAAGQII